MFCPGPVSCSIVSNNWEYCLSFPDQQRNKDQLLTLIAAHHWECNLACGHPQIADNHTSQSLPFNVPSVEEHLAHFRSIVLIASGIAGSIGQIALKQHASGGIVSGVVGVVRFRRKITVTSRHFEQTVTVFCSFFPLCWLLLPVWCVSTVVIIEQQQPYVPCQM